ncbi:acyl-CoA N-acyltransferase [Mycena latifolia]|nr:acyl-CoA N-acyltransferase [Mycena latifolia]
MTLTDSPPAPAEVQTVVSQHNSAVDFLDATYPTLRRHELSANIVLAHALKRAPAEYVLTECQFLTDADIQLPTSAQSMPTSDFWLTVWSFTAKSTPVLDMVLSCLHSSLGNYPIFLWTPVEHSQGLLPPQWFSHRIGEVAARLHACVGPERVFSVFGIERLVDPFVQVWTGLTGFQTAPEPLYTAFFAFCTPHTFKTPLSTPTQHTVRRATIIDVEEAGRLCQEFANSSEYPISTAQAMAEAEELIRKGQLWVYETDVGEIASICAVTRTSLHVSGITKVYTTPNWRRYGFAQELVQAVTRRLFECGKHSVVLYVGCENSAKRVYERVGFLTEEADVCVELGFVGTNVGHW